MDATCNTHRKKKTVMGDFERQTRRNKATWKCWMCELEDHINRSEIRYGWYVKNPCPVQGPVASSSDRDIKPLDSAKCGEFLEYLNHHYLHKKNFCSMPLLSKKKEE